jgi:lysozyme family protein
MDNFDYCIEKLIDVEGDIFTNIPDDNGGPTKYGITFKSYKAYKPETSISDLKNLTDEEAKKFYLSEYWLKYRLDQVNSKDISYFCLQILVNMSPMGATAIIQNAAKNTLVNCNLICDGKLGAQTVDALNIISKTNITSLYLANAKLCQIQRYVAIVDKQPSQVKFLKGWINRVLNA